jgi:hypothetical protein
MVSYLSSESCPYVRVENWASKTCLNDAWFILLIKLNEYLILFLYKVQKIYFYKFAIVEKK